MEMDAKIIESRRFLNRKLKEAFEREKKEKERKAFRRHSNDSIHHRKSTVMGVGTMKGVYDRAERRSSDSFFDSNEDDDLDNGHGNVKAIFEGYDLSDSHNDNDDGDSSVNLEENEGSDDGTTKSSLSNRHFIVSGYIDEIESRILEYDKELRDLDTYKSAVDRGQVEEDRIENNASQIRDKGTRVSTNESHMEDYINSNHRPFQAFLAGARRNSLDDWKNLQKSNEKKA